MCEVELLFSDAADAVGPRHFLLAELSQQHRVDSPPRLTLILLLLV